MSCSGKSVAEVYAPAGVVYTPAEKAALRQCESFNRLEWNSLPMYQGNYIVTIDDTPVLVAFDIVNNIHRARELAIVTNEYA